MSACAIVPEEDVSRFLCLKLVPFLDMKLFAPLLKFCQYILPILAGQYHNYTSPYSFNLGYSYNPTWLGNFSDSTSLTSLSIPGTHDTMTFPATMGAILQCQNQNLCVQLDAGVRYLDIRCTNVADQFLIYHYPLYTGYTFTSVLTTVFTFLDSHPSEMILMRIKEESPAINSTKSFEDVFNTYRTTNQDTKDGFAKHIWLPSSPGPTSVPTLGDLRGKVLILQNFGSDPAPYGIKYESPLLSIEDDYALSGYPDLDKKFSEIEANVVAAANGSSWDGGRGNGSLYLTHVSASVGVIPIEAAAGTKGGGVVGLNDRVGEWLVAEGGKGIGTTGVVILDFPGHELVEEVLARNRR